MSKKKKVLIIILIICLAVAVTATICAVVFKKSAPDETATNSGSRISNTTLASEDKEAFDNITSYTLENDTDTKIKIAFFNVIKKAYPESKMTGFDFLKKYEAFRIYDVTFAQEDEQTACVLCVYTEGGHAYSYSIAPYTDTADRAKQITKLIESFDKNYENLAATAKSSSSDNQLY